MASFSGKVDFEVDWYPFQLNSNAPKQPVSKLEMYMKKFGRSKADTLKMAAGMKQKFEAEGLPFNFTERGVTGNTINAHRLVSYAKHKGGLAMQDAVMEELFKNYFAEEKYPGDAQVLENAAVKAGISEAEAKTFVADENLFLKETMEEMALGRKMGVRGVPFFIIKLAGGKDQEVIEGAYPVEYFQEAVANLLP